MRKQTFYLSAYVSLVLGLSSQQAFSQFCSWSSYSDCSAICEGTIWQKKRHREGCQLACHAWANSQETPPACNKIHEEAKKKCPQGDAECTYGVHNALFKFGQEGCCI